MGAHQQFVFVRPTGVPGREIDVQFVIELERNAALRQQALAQQRAAIAQANAARQPSINPAFWPFYANLAEQHRQRQRRLTCTSEVLGASVVTDCR
jgi:hypothetical protein